MYQHDLQTDKPFLTALGLTSRRAGSRRKLQQVVGLLPWVLDAIDSGGPQPLVVEMGCGKGYVSFFAMWSCRRSGGAIPRAIGVDHDAAVVDRCRQIRDRLGWDGLAFIHTCCEDFRVACRPTLVASLHACDTATDHALAAGVDLDAAHILAVPCCHSTAQRALRTSGHRHYLGYLARSFPLLGARLSDLVTDAMRCLFLRAHGYQVEVREFVPGTVTPKNVLLVARRASIRGDRAADELARLEERFGITCEASASLRRRRERAASVGKERTDV